MIISIHQPNYLPWPGFFNKIFNSDVFVIYDDVQFPRGKDFVVRNLIKTESGPKWLRVPVHNKSKKLLIKQIEINNNIDWAKKHLNSLQNNYKKSPFYDCYFNHFEKILNKKWKYLVNLNLEIIKQIMKILSIKTKIILSSEMNINEKGTEKIIKIVQTLHGDQYFTGWGEGSRRYVEGQEKNFEHAGIEILYQNFKVPNYAQLFNDFEPNLSTCDILFNLGEKKSREIINVK